MIKLVLILVLVLITTVAHAGTYMNYARVYVGIDKTAMDSPVCLDNGSGNPNITGKAGIMFSLWMSNNKRWNLEGGYAHRSCLIAEDAPQSDGISFELSYTIPLNWFK